MKKQNPNLCDPTTLFDEIFRFDAVDVIDVFSVACDNKNNASIPTGPSNMSKISLPTLFPAADR